MNKPNEIEHENKLISRGQDTAVELIRKAEERSYYSSTKAGRLTLQAWMPVLMDALEKVTADAEAACALGNAT